ncbi:MAG: hypothetical protein CVT79_00420 [Alphaproteobacteria bacterium HGW-Alphaproteobacteria-18]|nr:MAG: hypothetical protein CVT79_00420 [Alphaproteobacteria bacterium HGW-Alphaproteobacteria-18]
MKRKNVHSPDAPDLMAEACAWLAQLETGNLSKEDLAAFREWIQRSPRHYAEIRRLAELSQEVNVLSAMAQPLREAARHRRLMRRPHRTSRGAGTLWRWGVLGLAGTFAFGLAVFSNVNPMAPELADPIYLSTIVGETQDISLTDGSSVKLNTDSKIEVNFTAGQRNVVLEKGEAFFEVTHDPGRPFTVYAGDRSVTAIGTAFSVSWINEELSVTVSEGKVAYGEAPARERPASVELLPSASKPSPTRMLGAGERLEVSSLSRAEVVESLPVNVMSRELAWRSGFLDFDDAPLEDVVKELQRYTPERIRIADQATANLRFGGVVRIGHTDAFFEALELSFGVQVEHTEDNQLVLRSAD